MTEVSVKQQLLADYRKTFRTPHGKRVLADLERRCKLVDLERHPQPGQPNEAFMNPNAALYRAGMADQVEAIRKRIKRAEELENEQKGQGAPERASGDAGAGRSITDT